MEEFNTKYGTSEKILGEGTYGQVFTTTIPGVVVKKGEFESIFAEMCIMAGLRKTGHVIHMLGFAANRETMEGMIAMPHMTGDISDAASFRDDVPGLFRQVCLGVAELHAQNVVHLDLKPANILHKGNRYYVADLGLASTNVCAAKDRLPWSEVVSAPFRPPEIWLRMSYGFPVDVWSLGVILFMLLTASVDYMYVKFNDFFDVFGKPTEADWPGVTSSSRYAMIATDTTVSESRSMLEDVLHENGIPQEAITLLLDMFTMDPARRPTVFDVLRSPYLGNSPVPRPLSCFERMDARSRVPDWHPSLAEVRMRSVLASWMLELHIRMELPSPIFGKAVHVMDSYLSHIAPEFPRRRLQMIGAASHYIACDVDKRPQYESTYVEFSANSFTQREFMLCVMDVILAVAASATETTAYEYLHDTRNVTLALMDLSIISGFGIDMSPRDLALDVMKLARHEPSYRDLPLARSIASLSDIKGLPHKAVVESLRQ